MNRAILAVLIILSAFFSTASVNQERRAPVRLTVYLYDDCGGCGANNPGCGECKDIDRYHNIIKKQFGERLYDGGIEYRMYNCRLDVNENNRLALGERYGVPEALRNVRPVAYIGGEDAGLYLPGEALLHYVGETLDRYAAGEEPDGIQNDVLRIYGG